MFNPNKTLAIVYNGELFNFKELREELRVLGHQFVSESDTEVVLAAYEEWGGKCLHRFNGIFAFAVLHIRTGKVFLARDRLGVNPLYYYHKKGRFIFSSEIKALFAHNIEKQLDMDALNIYFRLFYVPAPKTIWQNVHKLSPAHCAVFENGELHTERYWDPTAASFQHSQESTEEIRAQIKILIDDSVRSQLVSDRPVGLFLSGGIDSTIVCGAVSALEGSVETFSVGFEHTEQAEKYNLDFELARRTAKFFGTKHHEFLLSVRDVQNNFERALYHLDEPISDHIQTANLFLAEQSVRHVSVVLGGDGGDEVWGGYSRYYYNEQIERVRRLPTAMRVGLLQPLLRLAGKSRWVSKAQTMPGVERHLTFWGQ